MEMDEPQEGTYWERATLRRWLTGERVDIRVVKRQVAALLAFVEEQEGTVTQEDPQERPERSAEGLSGPRALRWTGDNEEAVRDFLGARYEKTRGGLDENDPKVVWFRNDDPHGYLSWARPGDWLILDGDRITVVEDEHYGGPRE